MAFSLFFPRILARQAAALITTAYAVTWGNIFSILFYSKFFQTMIQRLLSKK
jgi:hypothetical protein